jgi:hypothetical protein
MLEWPVVVKSPGLSYYVCTCRNQKEDYSIVVCWLERELIRLAGARPGRYAGVIAVCITDIHNAMQGS